MLGFKVIILLTTCLSWTYCKLDKYCSVCEDHTMCKYHGIGKDCENVGASGVTKDEIKEILDTHNWARRIVALGHETRGADGPQPKAANMMKLIWDDELSKVAQRWADQCRFQHDVCRDDPRWKVGQNIYWKWKYPKHQVNWTEAILSWYNEVAFYKPQDVDSYRFESSTGHYTQMLWHDTYTIGCGRRDYGPNKLYVCNYGPAGNWLGEPMYDIGEPCSKCPKGTTCDDALCAHTVVKPKIEIPSETEGLGTNSLRILHLAEIEGRSSDNETLNIKILKPSNENSRSIDDESEDETETPAETENESQKPEKGLGPVAKVIKNILLLTGRAQKPAINSVDENDVVLDLDTQNAIEDIKLRIEALVKNVYKKLTAKN